MIQAASGTHVTRPRRGLRRKAVSFALIGVANTAVDALAFVLFLAVDAPMLLANLLAWCCGVSVSFALNSRWTFDPAPGLAARHGFLRFVATGASVSLLCSTGFLALLAPAVGVWPAKAAAVAAGAILGFFAARWSIEGRPTPPERGSG